MNELRQRQRRGTLSNSTQSKERNTHIYTGLMKGRRHTHPLVLGQRVVDHQVLLAFRLPRVRDVLRQKKKKKRE